MSKISKQVQSVWCYFFLFLYGIRITEAKHILRWQALLTILLHCCVFMIPLMEDLNKHLVWPWETVQSRLSPFKLVDCSVGQIYTLVAFLTMKVFCHLCRMESCIMLFFSVCHAYALTLPYFRPSSCLSCSKENHKTREVSGIRLWIPDPLDSGILIEVKKMNTSQHHIEAITSSYWCTNFHKIFWNKKDNEANSQKGTVCCTYNSCDFAGQSIMYKHRLR